MRAFIALPLDDELRKRIAESLMKWRQFDPELKWVDPALLHVTLRFLGEIDPSLLPKFEQAIRETARDVAPFVISLGRAGAFPSLARPRVFWLGLSPANRLLSLASELDRKLAQLGWGNREERFVSHLTVARLRREVRPLPGFLTYWQRLADGSEEGPAGSWMTDRLVLYESRLHPRGPEYLPLLQVKLLDGQGRS